METQQQETSSNNNKLHEETQTQTQQQSSPSSSPSHEFSFTFSLQNPEPITTTTRIKTTTTTTTTAIEKSNKPPFAIDLSPADDIFFHGHLLPLHFLSPLQNHTSSPRSSTNSLDNNFTLPIKEIDQKHDENGDDDDDDDCFSYHSKDFDQTHEPNNNNPQNSNTNTKQNNTNKSKHFSLFGSLAKWRKPSENNTKQHQPPENQNQNQNKKRVKFDVSHFVKRYMKMMKPILLSSRDKNSVGVQRRQAYSFSSASLIRDNKSREVTRGRRGEFSAPASMRTSPTNSGRLVVATSLPPPATDSTMEELQAAIQAAIAHCKNSISSQNNTSKTPQDTPVHVN